MMRSELFEIVIFLVSVVFLYSCQEQYDKTKAFLNSENDEFVDVMEGINGRMVAKFQIVNLECPDRYSALVDKVDVVHSKARSVQNQISKIQKHILQQDDFALDSLPDELLLVNTDFENDVLVGII